MYFKDPLVRKFWLQPPPPSLTPQDQFQRLITEGMGLGFLRVLHTDPLEARLGEEVARTA